jgi:AcrR family transcriptional regulator
MTRGDGRARIRHAAATLFGERGYHDVTVREIADAAMVSPGLVIKLFGSKAELYTVVGLTAVPLVELDLPRDRLGRALVQQVLTRRDAGANEPWATLVSRIRQSPTPEATRHDVLSGVAAIIGDTTPDRRHAAAVACQLAGLAEGIRFAGYFAPPDINSDDVVDLYADAVQHQIDQAG